MNTSVIIYGPQGSGKSRHAAALAKHFGLQFVEEEWTQGQPLNPTNVLYLTNDRMAAHTMSFGVRVMPLDDALKELP